jgi:hypothetical protein
VGGAQPSGRDEGLEDRSRAPRRHPNQTAADIEQQVLQLRGKHPPWGPRKLRKSLHSQQPGVAWPVLSTIGELLKREGLTVPRRKRRRTPPYTQPLDHATGPNQVWCADFKGFLSLIRTTPTSAVISSTAQRKSHRIFPSQLQQYSIGVLTSSNPARRTGPKLQVPTAFISPSTSSPTFLRPPAP